LIRCSGFVDESPTVTLSRFKADLCENFHRELFARGVCDLEHAYQIVRDLDVSQGSYFQDNLDYKSQSTKSNPEQSQYKNVPVLLSKRKMTKEKDMLKVYLGPTLALNVINARARFVLANSKPSIWVNNKIRKGKIH